MESSELLLEWIQQSLPCPIQKEALEPVKTFALIWNIYEAKFFKKKAHGETVFKSVICSTEAMSEKLYKAIIDRYIDKETGMLNERYAGLFNGKESDHDNEVKRILMLPEPTKEEINKVCRMVAWRYRNNLFHGEKSAHEIYEDNSLFEPINAYLLDTIMHFNH